MRDWPLKSWTRVPLLRDQSDVATSVAAQIDQLGSEYRLSFSPQIKGQAYDSGNTPPTAKAGCSVKNSRCSAPDLQKTDTGFRNPVRDSQTERRGSLPPNNAIRVFLNDAARFPKSCDWHMGVLPLRSGQLTATPGSVLTQQPAGGVQVDLQTVTPKHFLFHSVDRQRGWSSALFPARSQQLDPPSTNGSAGDPHAADAQKFDAPNVRPPIAALHADGLFVPRSTERRPP